MTNPRKPPQGTRAASRSAARSRLGESTLPSQGLRSRVGPRARTFARARVSRAAALHFLVVSDWGGLPVWPWVTPAQIGVADAMGRIASRHRSKFALSLGDHFYFSGVRDEKDPRFRRTFERAFRAPSLLAPGFFRVVAGNHDHDGNISAQLAYASRRNSRWRYPALQNHGVWLGFVTCFNTELRPIINCFPMNYSNDSDQHHISYDLAYTNTNSHAWRESVPSGDGAVVAFVLIDTVVLCGMPRQPPPADAETHWRWLTKALEDAQDADFLVVGGHYPVHSPASHGPTKCLQRRLLPLLTKHSVDVYFSGHDHALFHVCAPGAAAVQFHGVGAGFTTTSSQKHLRTCAKQLRFHHRGVKRPLNAFSGGFAGVSVNASAISVVHYDASGKRLYAHAKQRTRTPAKVVLQL